MTLNRIFGGSVAAVCFAFPAVADITAAEVWQDWKSIYKSYGYTVTAQESSTASTVALRDVTIQIDMGGKGRTTAVIPAIDLVGQSDGTVMVTLSDSMPVTFDTGEGMSGLLTYSSAGLVLTVSGKPGDLIYAYRGDRMGLTLNTLTDNGTPVAIDSVTGTLRNFAGQTSSIAGTLRETTQTLRADALDYVVKVPAGETPDSGIDLTGSAQPLTLTTSARLPDMPAGGRDMAAAVAAGLTFDLRIEHGGSQVSYAIPGPDGGTGTSSAASGGLRVALVDKGLTYDGTASSIKLNMVMNAMPLPIEATMAQSRVNLTFPMGAAGQQQDFAFGVTLGDLVLSDIIWAMLDPTSQLPRDPATLVLDLAGKATMKADMMAAETATMPDVPMQIDTLSIRDIVLRLAGAELTGKGAFTFDNTDMVTIPGIPRPNGAVDLKLVGGNALLDKLIAMGMVQQEQAMGARMMMALFAVVAGEDTLTSKIEVNEQGHVMANGQRLQ